MFFESGHIYSVCVCVYVSVRVFQNFAEFFGNWQPILPPPSFEILAGKVWHSPKWSEWNESEFFND